MKFPVSYLCLEKWFLVANNNSHESKRRKTTVQVSLQWSIGKEHFLDIDQTVIVVDLLCKGGGRNSHNM